MDAGILELVKLWGPLSLGWVAAVYMAWFIMTRYDKDIESRVALATAINSLKEAVERLEHNHG